MARPTEGCAHLHLPPYRRRHGRAGLHADAVVRSYRSDRCHLSGGTSVCICLVFSIPGSDSSPAIHCVRMSALYKLRPY